MYVKAYVGQAGWLLGTTASATYSISLIVPGLLARHNDLLCYILIYDPAERTANIHAVPANMLLNPSPHISIFQFFLFFMNSTLLTKQDQTVSLRPSAKTYLRKKF